MNQIEQLNGNQENQNNIAPISHSFTHLLFASKQTNHSLISISAMKAASSK